MEYRWIEDIEDFRKIAAEWDSLVAAASDPQPFLLSDFLITWWKYFGKGKKLRIFVVEEGGKVKGGLPLCLNRGSAREGFAEFLHHVGEVAANYTEPLYSDGGPEIFPLLARALSGRRDWDVFCLTDIREGSRLLKELKGAPHHKDYSVFLISDHDNYAIDLGKGLESYQSSLSPKLKRDLKSKRKHITQKYGAVTLVKASGEKEVRASAALYKKFSRDAFAARNRKSTFENDKYADFFAEFLVLMEKAGRLDAHLLKAGDAVLAISFAYRFGRGFNWVLTAFDYEYKYYRPGYILIEELLKEICARGETYYNWYGHGRFYKDQLCNLLEPLYKVMIVRKTIKGSSYMLSQKAKKAVKYLKGLVEGAR
ncbi:MAG TPA: GNAT family N-acetyltransferase [Candidatus Omnitrophota bacterium]|nr:GNAT family N-acetyltransferase [Candidatus Omnitrophota bacterium]